MNTTRRLGVLGGMGPLASASFLTRLILLTPARRDQDHIPLVLWSDPRVPDRTAAQLAGGEDPLPWMLEGIRRLEAAGCGAIAIPCNTAHIWYAALQAATPLPILHIVEATADELGRIGVRRGTVGLLATAGTVATQLYQESLQRRGYRCVVPEEEELHRLVTPAIAAVKANRVGQAYAPLAEAAGLLAARGAEAIVLGCTEIPLAMAAGPPLALPVADSLDALARAAITWATKEPV